MRRSRFSDEQVIAILKVQESGAADSQKRRAGDPRLDLLHDPGDARVHLG